MGFEVTWAPTLPVSPGGPYAVDFEQEEASILTKAARLLRALSPLEQVGLTGVVTNLRREHGEEDGVATVYGVVDGDLRRVIVPLPAAEYDLAIKAHREKVGVYFVADLIPAGRQYHATNISGFRLT